MIWADRIALAAAVIIFVPLVVIGLGLEPGRSTALLLPVYAVVCAIVPFWIILRALDLICGGPKRRQFKATYFRR